MIDVDRVGIGSIILRTDTASRATSENDNIHKKFPMTSADAGLKVRISSLRSDNLKLRREIGMRAKIAAGLRTKGRRVERALNDSKILQRDLRELAQQAMRAQEDQRLRFSHELHDDIGQTLLGLHVKLLALRSETRQAKYSITGSIINTQQIIKEFARSLSKEKLKSGRK